MGATSCFISDRIKQVEQPEGGYINPETLQVEPVGEGADAWFCDRDIEDVLLIRHSGERRKIAPPPRRVLF